MISILDLQRQPRLPRTLSLERDVVGIQFGAEPAAAQALGDTDHRARAHEWIEHDVAVRLPARMQGSTRGDRTFRVKNGGSRARSRLWQGFSPQ